MKRLPIGVENFKELIDKNFYYVDKTEFINDVLNNKVALYTRPRRFGKTLNMNMLYYFFSNKEKQNAYLFDGLKITENKEAMKHQNQYPVISISLKDIKGLSFSAQLEMLNGLIARIVDRNSELLTSSKLTEIEINQLVKYQYKQENLSETKEAFYFISQCLYKHYGNKVIILIDEYDVPLQNSYINNTYDEMVDLISGLFSSALKTNDALEKGIMTGCLRIAKESIFTGLNNFSVYSISDEQSSTMFGFTQAEIQQLMEDYSLSEKLPEIKEWYDGYIFHTSEIYNPWSTLRYVNQLVATSTNEPESFWANTSSNDIVVNYIKQGDSIMQEDFSKLVAGESIIKTIKPELTYREMDDINNIYSFLLFTGYLKAIRKVDTNTYELMIPNKEVREVYEQSFQSYFRNYQNERRNSFYHALLNGEEKEVQNLLSQILSRSVSYYDTQENFYHGLVIGLISGNDCTIESNQESGFGRFDIAVESINLNDAGVIIECKKVNAQSELRKAASEARKQIVDNNYFAKLEHLGYEKFYGYGIAFYKKMCVVTKVE